MEFKISDNKSISYYTSNILGTPNAFLTRCGGFSEKYGLNLALGREDSDETVLRNLELVADTFGFKSEDVISLPQAHSSDVLIVKKEAKGLGYFREGDPVDGYVTDESGVVLGVKTADCVPILLSAKRNGKVIAVGALHAGWRGTVKRICERGVEAMRVLGVMPEEIYAAIGPAASVCCYEIGEGVHNTACGEIEGADRYFERKPNGKLYVDLKGLNASLLRECGVPAEHIEISNECTICEERFFYSHRRDGEYRGTHLNLVWMK